jgi:putative DeoR family transcriptional regulator (stage III sporulation protein D)
MKGMPEERTILAAEYIIKNGATVRSAAKKFGVSKSTIHKDVSERLRHLNPELFSEVKAVLEKNKQERHIRGGKATKETYAKLH